LLVSDECPACHRAEQVWDRYLGNSIEKVNLNSLPHELREQIQDNKGRIATPQFIVVLSDGRVLGTIPAIPSAEEILATCALCGGEEDLKRCNICGGIFLCPRCRRRYFRRGLAALSYWLRGWWTDDLGLRRRKIN